MAVSLGKAPPRSIEEARAELAEVLPQPQSMALQHSRLQEIQDQILERSLGVVDGAVRFAEIDRDATEPPVEWLEELGEKEAMRRFRIAKAAWEGAKTSPTAFKVATQMAVGILRAKASETGPRTLNIQIAHLSAPIPSFPERDHES
jgi:hypothetical protein